ncbi:MAG TPA: right-handed parallel beta-helix repeat-containing protein [Rhizomicrobium sp.]|nr:right-handed parallel beta-helix repeat-containing protein [Rhizomicrobium sp.]
MRGSIAVCLVFLTGNALAAGPVHRLVLPPDTVALSPGDDIQAAVDAYPGGTTFHLTAGVYRIQSVNPKAGDAFIGDAGAELNGAKVLTEFDRDGALYVARDQPVDPNTQIQGVCRHGYPRCGYPQDLYFDGRPLRAVAKKSKVVPATFFYDYEHDTVYFADDPTGHTVELSFRPFAFGGKAKDVTVQNLIVENYACADQQGAIGDHGQGKSWEITDNEVRWNHGVGISAPPQTETKRNFVHHNGDLGVGAGSGSGALQDNEIAFNVWNGTDCNWECGGVKWAQVTEWFVTGNYVHDNQGDGLWADIDSGQMLFDSNRIEHNLLAGISFEISGPAIISNNILRDNGAKTFNWGWDGQIQIQNSWGVEVYGNTVDLDRRRGGNGIIIVQQNRGRRHMPGGNTIHDNDVTIPGGDGAVAGWFADYKPRRFSPTNQFDNNHYHVYAPGGSFWAPNEWARFADWQATGQDAHSTVDSNIGAAR